MPINSMGEGFAKFTSFLPGTYLTVIFRKGFLNNVLSKMKETLPEEMVNGIANGFDVNYSFFEHDISLWMMFLISIISVVIACIALLLVAYLKDKIRLKR